MKRHLRLLLGTSVLVLAIAIAGLPVLAKEKVSENKKEKDEISVSWDKLPGPVQQTIEAQLKTAKPETITQEEDDDYVLYEAAQTVDGRLKEIKVAENGQIVELEESIPTSDLPAAVVEKIKKRATKAEIKEARRVVVYSYEVEISNDDRTKEIKVYGNGQQIENED